MPKYQDPNFKKEEYWKVRGDIKLQKVRRILDRASNKGQVYSSPTWPRKPVTKKAILKNSRRAQRGVTFTEGVT